MTWIIYKLNSENEVAGTILLVQRIENEKPYSLDVAFCQFDVAHIMNSQ